MPKIDIDQEVFEFLQKKAEPFVDTPNTVLRKILGIEKAIPTVNIEEKTIMKSTSGNSGIDTNTFVQQVLKKEFPGTPQRKPPYRYMFESENRLIYFQNFNQESATLWYRVAQKPLEVLRKSDKQCFICLTNPAERVAYLIPLEDIENLIASAKWKRDYLEINIDHTSHKWKELDWKIEKYLKVY